MTREYEMHGKSTKGSSNRTFGLVFAVFFCVIALQPIWHGDALRIWAAWLASIILILAIMAPSVLAPLNRLWTKFGLLLHGVVSPIALGILFFGVITPMAIVMRIVGKDPLRRKFDNNATSYWIPRDPPGPAPDSMNNQF